MIQGRGHWRLAALVAVALVVLAVPAVGAPRTVTTDRPSSSQNGVTQPVFGYADAIRERVWVDADFDTDSDGVNDLIAIDIIRPAGDRRGPEGAGRSWTPSPYYSTLGRGNESELKQDDDGDGLLDKWPLFYDNYFVPRGYAVVLLRHDRHQPLDRLPDVRRHVRQPQRRRSASTGSTAARPRYDKDGNLVTRRPGTTARPA